MYIHVKYHSIIIKVRNIDNFAELFEHIFILSEISCKWYMWSYIAEKL